MSTKDSGNWLPAVLGARLPPRVLTRTGAPSAIGVRHRGSSGRGPARTGARPGPAMAPKCLVFRSLPLPRFRIPVSLHIPDRKVSSPRAPPCSPHCRSRRANQTPPSGHTPFGRSNPESRRMGRGLSARDAVGVANAREEGGAKGRGGRSWSTTWVLLGVAQEGTARSSFPTPEVFNTRPQHGIRWGFLSPRSGTWIKAGDRGQVDSRALPYRPHARGPRFNSLHHQ